MPRASSNACKRPTSGSSASGSKPDVDVPKFTGNDWLVPAKLCANATFAKLSLSPLNAAAELLDNVDGCCVVELFAVDNEIDTPDVCDVDGWFWVIDNAESSDEKNDAARIDVDTFELLVEPPAPPDEAAKLW